MPHQNTGHIAFSSLYSKSVYRTSEILYNSHIEPVFLRRGEAAKYLQVSPRTLAAWIARGHVPYIRIGARLMLFRRADLDKTMERFKERFSSVNHTEWKRPQSFHWSRYGL